MWYKYYDIYITTNIWNSNTQEEKCVKWHMSKKLKQKIIFYDFYVFFPTPCFIIFKKYRQK